jgi:hypothetical protein
VPPGAGLKKLVMCADEPASTAPRQQRKTAASHSLRMVNRRRRHHNGQASVEQAKTRARSARKRFFFAARFPQFQTAFSIFQTGFQGLFTEIK